MGWLIDQRKAVSTQAVAMVCCMTKSLPRLGFFGEVLIHSGQGMPVQDKGKDTSVLAASLKYSLHKVF